MVKFYVASVALMALFGSCVSVHAQSNGQGPSLLRRVLRTNQPYTAEVERKLGYLDGCNNVTIDFSKAADGTPLQPGQFVKNEWLSLGFTLSATGGVSDTPRLFNTAVPRGPDGMGGDNDLGAPNNRCSPAGPGVGDGGAPGMEGENCEPQGLVLIIQEDNELPSIPDDNRGGGTIVFDFDEDTHYVFEIGLLDIEETNSTLEVLYESESGITTKVISIPGLGNNSFQKLAINLPNVRQMVLNFEGSGAVTFVSYCSPSVPPPATSTPTPSPTKSPTAKPTASPTAAPTPEPCVNVTVDFETDSNGNPLELGEYLNNQYAGYGLSLTASGGFGGLPHLFDSTIPRSQSVDRCGDTDLGAPNKACSPPGPGKGVGGAPGTDGENCDPLGNILIIQEPGSGCPDDNRGGGMIVFDFFATANYVYDMTFLDIDEEKANVTVSYLTDDGMKETVFNLQNLGENAKQTLEINIKDVKQVKVTFPRTGAVTSIDFCYNPDDIPTAPPAVTVPPTAAPSKSPTPPPTASPTKEPTPSPTASPTKSPTASPTASPTKSPTDSPTASPTKSPTDSPTVSPTKSPTASPTKSPTPAPTNKPTASPTDSPTPAPTKSPTKSPTESPTKSPTESPTSAPTKQPTAPPTDSPTPAPTKSPTPSPTQSPTTKPTASPTAAPTPDPCVNVTVDFETDSNGNPLEPGEYLNNQYAGYGLSLTASGGFGGLPRLFDSANPRSQSEDSCGDPDLGTPNKACSPSGPGIGAGGAPGTDGAIF